MEVILSRRHYSDTQVTGDIFVFSDDGIPIGCFVTLELPWKNNEKRVSCIEPFVYMLHPHNSPKFGKCLWVKAKNGAEILPGGRSEILIHAANFSRQLLGCIAPGLILTDIDGDGNRDVKYSRNAVTALCDLITKPTKFRIIG
jgi:hypothetical protein